MYLVEYCDKDSSNSYTTFIPTCYDSSTHLWCIVHLHIFLCQGWSPVRLSHSRHSRRETGQHLIVNENGGPGLQTDGVNMQVIKHIYCIKEICTGSDVCTGGTESSGTARRCSPAPRLMTASAAPSTLWTSPRVSPSWKRRTMMMTGMVLGITIIPRGTSMLTTTILI